MIPDVMSQFSQNCIKSANLALQRLTFLFEIPGKKSLLGSRLECNEK